MATLRHAPSISTLLNPSPVATIHPSNSRLRLPSIPRANQAKLTTQAPANLPTLPSNPLTLLSNVSSTNSTSESEQSVSLSLNGALLNFVSEHARELAIGSAVFALVCLPDEHALALGPGGPLMEEFWDNVRRYGFYFFTVVSGGLYSLAKPLVELMKDPSTQILVIIAVIGTFYLMYLTVSTMLGLNDFVYEYSQ